jgi:hypothetical protein
MDSPWKDELPITTTSGLPVWIIRNGLNDKAQNGSTDFDIPPDGSSNGNGEAAFKVKPRYWVMDGTNPGGTGPVLTWTDGDLT